MSDTQSNGDDLPPAERLGKRISRVRHDLRSPLTNIIGFADILIEEAPAEGLGTFLEDFRRIRQLSSQIFEAINQTLDMDSLRKKPATILHLQSEIFENVPGIRAAIKLLLAQSAVKENDTYAEDLERIASGAEQLLERAQHMLDELSQLLREVIAEERELRATGMLESGDSTFITHQLVAEEKKPAVEPIRKERITNAAILVVDDNESNRILLSRRLSRQSHRVDVAADGLEAMDKIQGNDYDCILLDVIMPGLDGYQVLEKVKADKRLRHVPVIMISAMDDIESLVRCIEHGADDYITKPFDPILLGARVNACLEKKQLRDQEQSLIHRLQDEQALVEKLLLNILPERVAERLKNGESPIVDQFEEATVMFADLVGFTGMFDRQQPKEIVQILNEIFSALDALSERHGLEKIKTIGDAYLVVSGIPSPRNDHIAAMASMALEVNDTIAKLNRDTEVPLEMRMGIHTGPVLAGIIGEKKFIYDLWGDTVNTASRMESHGEPGRIQVTDTVFQALESDFTFAAPRTLDVKGRGEMTTRFLTGKR
ncbi:MAG: adenylate/guanylate cyclase domain-containing protein [Limisphaerales bacterium]